MNKIKAIEQAAGAPAAIGTYSPAVAAGGLVFVSGQIPLDPQTMEVVEGDFAAQTRRVFENLAALCQAAGGGLDSLAKLTVYMTDLSRFAEFNSIAAEYLKPPLPARTAVGVSSLPKGVMVEVEGIMLAP